VESQLEVSRSQKEIILSMIDMFFFRNQEGFPKNLTLLIPFSYIYIYIYICKKKYIYIYIYINYMYQFYLWIYVCLSLHMSHANILYDSHFYGISLFIDRVQYIL
jgi:hypothetical protein